MKLIIISIVCLFSSLVFAQHQHDGPPLIGVHGMAVFDINGKFYASHMPLADSIHAHQVVFSFALNERDKQSYQALHREFSLVTIVPEKFDLAKLIDGSLTRFKANVHANHFERGGELKLQDVEVEVTQLLLTRLLGDKQGGHYYQVSLEQSSSMLIHRIATRPSFDQILIARSNEQLPNSELVKLTNGEPWPGSSIYSRSIESIYLETQDFQ